MQSRRRGSRRGPARRDNAANNETRTPGNAPANGRKRTHAKTCTNSKKGRPCRKVKQFTASRA